MIWQSKKKQIPQEPDLLTLMEKTIKEQQRTIEEQENLIVKLANRIKELEKSILKNE